LSSLEADLKSEQLPVQIVAVGGMQFHSTTADINGMAAGGNLPIVEETAQQPVWREWGAQWRDLYILDADGNLSNVTNLTYFDPDPSVNNGQNYAQLKSLFFQAEAASSSSTQFAVATLAVTQDAGSAVLTLTRTGDIMQAATVTATTSDGTAQANTDYLPIATTIGFTPGSSTATVSIPIINHQATAPTTTFDVSLSDPTNGMHLGDPAQAVVTIYNSGPTPNQRYVTAVYQALLHRPVEGDGMAYWTSFLDAGGSSNAMATIITHSAEYLQLNVIEPAYTQFLHRAADQPGLDYWTTQLQKGMSDVELQAALLASPEFYATASSASAPLDRTPSADRLWIDALYQSVLGRTADQAGENYWADLLHGRVTLYTIARSFSSTAENQSLGIEQSYQQYLGRPADSAGLAYWLDQFQRGAANETLVAGLVGSDEFFKQATS
jgi:hypothetical protein